MDTTILPEDIRNVPYRENVNKIVDIYPKVSFIASTCYGFRQFFELACSSLSDADYRDMIRAILTSGQEVLVLVVIDCIALRGEASITYNDFWLESYKKYLDARTRFQLAYKQEKAALQKEYEANARKYKEEYLKNLARLNVEFEEGILKETQFNKRRDDGHSTFTSLCTEDYQRMNVKLQVIEAGYLNLQYKAWKEELEKLINYLRDILG